MAKKKHKKSSLGKAILYLSDLYVVVMVVAWILAILIVMGCAIYDLFHNGGTSLFSELSLLVGIPATAGGAMWLIRCCIQHNHGADPDFPNIEENGGQE